jgi:hypothetical protein
MIGGLSVRNKRRMNRIYSLKQLSLDDMYEFITEDIGYASMSEHFSY